MGLLHIRALHRSRLERSGKILHRTREMNKQIAQGTLAGMTDDHFLASVEALLETPLERELFKRLEERAPHDEILHILGVNGLDDVDSLTYYPSLPECPSKDSIEDMLDDALYLQNALTEGGEVREVADRLCESLKKLQERLV